MLRIGACNDGTEQLGKVASACRRWTDRSCLSVEFQRFHSVDELLFEHELKGHFDIVFIGTVCETRSAAESAARLLREDRNISIVFLVGTLQSVGPLPVTHPFYFLQKPFGATDVGAFLDAYSCQIPPAKFVFEYERIIHAVPVRDILFFRHERRKNFIHKADGTVEEFYMKLDETEELLKGTSTPFLRIHESYLINFYRICQISRNYVLMEDGTGLPISAARREDSLRKARDLLRLH